MNAFMTYKLQLLAPDGGVACAGEFRRDPDRPLTPVSLAVDVRPDGTPSLHALNAFRCLALVELEIEKKWGGAE